MKPDLPRQPSRRTLLRLSLGLLAFRPWLPASAQTPARVVTLFQGATDSAVALGVTPCGIVDSWSYFLANTDFTEANGDLVPEILDELRKVGNAAQANFEETVKALATITGVPQEVTRVVLSRRGANLGAVSTLTDEVVAYQQSLADEFYDLKIIPRKLSVSDIVWRPKQS